MPNPIMVQQPTIAVWPHITAPTDPVPSTQVFVAVMQPWICPIAAKAPDDGSRTNAAKSKNFLHILRPPFLLHFHTPLSWLKTNGNHAMKIDPFLFVVSTSFLPQKSLTILAVRFQKAFPCLKPKPSCPSWTFWLIGDSMELCK